MSIIFLSVCSSFHAFCLSLSKVSSALERVHCCVVWCISQKCTKNRYKELPSTASGDNFSIIFWNIIDTDCTYAIHSDTSDWWHNAVYNYNIQWSTELFKIPLSLSPTAQWLLFLSPVPVSEFGFSCFCHRFGLEKNLAAMLRWR